MHPKMLDILKDRNAHNTLESGVRGILNKVLWGRGNTAINPDTLDKLNAGSLSLDRRRAFKNRSHRRSVMGGLKENRLKSAGISPRDLVGRVNERRTTDSPNPNSVVYKLDEGHFGRMDVSSSRVLAHAATVIRHSTVEGLSSEYSSWSKEFTLMSRLVAMHDGIYCGSQKNNSTCFMQTHSRHLRGFSLLAPAGSEGRLNTPCLSSTSSPDAMHMKRELCLLAHGKHPVVSDECEVRRGNYPFGDYDRGDNISMAIGLYS